MTDDIARRLYKRALANQLAIVVGSSMSDERYSIPSLAQGIKAEFKVDLTVEHPIEWFMRWNDLLKTAEGVTPTEQEPTRRKIAEFVASRASGAKPTQMQLAIAHLPISNFVDTTFDRSFLKALHAAGRTPLVHDWNRQMMGDWKQPNVATPNVFFMLPNPLDYSPWFGVFEQSRTKQSIQLSNIGQMFDGKDILLLDFSPEEAEGILVLSGLCLSGEKFFNYIEEEDRDSPYWCGRGVMTVGQPPTNIIGDLTPSRAGNYTGMDILIPRRTISDIMRSKQFDTFVSYFHGDKEFARQLDRDLDRRGLYIWRDEHELEIGDSLSEKIQEGLGKSYSVIVILSPEALGRPFFKEELNTAFALRREGQLKIFPVLHRPCDIPLFLRDYYYADFSNPDLYELRIADLERAIKNTVARAQEKK
jgi:hypothetical protein